MAELPPPKLLFDESCDCGDCAAREISLPRPLPPPGDDFEWLVRDYDGFRAFMMEELAARFTERTRWTPADMEVVIVETLAVVLDQLSNMLDRVTSEGFLATARRPQSVRRLLKMIGFDAVRDANVSTPEELERLWLTSPHLMEAAREQGPRQIHTQ
jgi:hypothetical protein